VKDLEHGSFVAEAPQDDTYLFYLSMKMSLSYGSRPSPSRGEGRVRVPFLVPLVS